MFSRCSILRACTKLTRTDNPPLKSAELNSAKTKTLRNFFAQPFRGALLITGLLSCRGLPGPLSGTPAASMHGREWICRDGEQRIHSLVFVLMIDVGVVRMGVDQLLVLVAMSMRFAVRSSGECSCS
jgi:hypothetical protein